jgi:DNA-binding transcriptional ArsR family regulator
VYAYRVHAFDVLADPVRRRLVEVLAEGEASTGELTAVIKREFRISQPGVSRHLRCSEDQGSRSSARMGAAGSTPPSLRR